MEPMNSFKMISNMNHDAVHPISQGKSQLSFTVDSPIDPENMVRVDALVLEKVSHPFQLAPFLLVIKPDKSVILQSCRVSVSAWDPEKRRVYGVFGTCPRSGEKNDDEHTHTIGLFAINPSSDSDDELIVYTIDGKEHVNDDAKDYLECRNVAVDVFLTRVLNLPSSTHHSTRTVSFSLMRVDDYVNSSLHVRQCFRELAGMIYSVAGILSAEVLLDIVNTGFPSGANAFHTDALFDGVRLQMARRCWTKDLEDATACFLHGDDAQYTGSYGTMVTTPLTDEEEGLEARNAKLLVSTLQQDRAENKVCSDICLLLLVRYPHSIRT